ncbi:MAG: hypothetical protein WCL14_08395, partial [Bacteroidota bacterium]
MFNYKKNKKMKALALAKVTTNPELENLIHKKDIVIKDLARKNGKHYAGKNQPAPTGEKLDPYIGDIRTGYEELASQAHQFLQPGTHLPEGQLEADRAKEKYERLDKEIFDLKEKNSHDNYELNHSDSKGVNHRIRIALVVTAIILIGEILFNAKAFEISGENLLFALLISFAVSVSVYALSHVVPLIYKKIDKPANRWIFVVLTSVITVSLFIALANLRVILLAQRELSISPVIFVIINLFLFIVSVFLSYHFLPSLEEIKGSLHVRNLNKVINNRIKEIASKEKEKEELKIYIMEKAKTIVRINNYSDYISKRIEKMYHESAEIFKSTNLTFRTDRKVPDCFYDALPSADVTHLIAQNYF